LPPLGNASSQATEKMNMVLAQKVKIGVYFKGNVLVDAIWNGISVPTRMRAIHRLILQTFETLFGVNSVLKQEFYTPK
jgi:hypothetical protein